MAGPKILIPYNFTPMDEKTLDFAAANFADREDAEITLFNAYTSAPQIDMRNSPVMDKMAANLNYLRQKAHENEGALKAARKKLIDKGFPKDRVSHMFKPKVRDAAHDIVSTVQKGGFDVVIISRKPGGVARFFTGSVFEKVVTSLKGVAVCVVT